MSYFMHTLSLHNLGALLNGSQHTYGSLKIIAVFNFPSFPQPICGDDPSVWRREGEQTRAMEMSVTHIDKRSAQPNFEMPDRDLYLYCCLYNCLSWALCSNKNQYVEQKSASVLKSLSKSLSLSVSSVPGP